MKQPLLLLITFLNILFCHAQVPNDDCSTAMDYGIFPFQVQPSCPNGGAPYIGDDDDLTNVTPSSPYYFMTGCLGYTSATTSLADDIWYKYRGFSNATKIWMFGIDTLHVNFYYGTSCNNLQPSACFTYLPSYNDTIFTVYSNTDTTNFFNYIQISSNISGKQFWYFVCIDQPTFSIPPPIYGTIHINTNTSIIESSTNGVHPILSPNPVRDFIFINKYSVYDPSQIEIIDGYGNLVKTSENVDTSIHVADLENGIYFVRLKLINQAIFIKKLIILH